MFDDLSGVGVEHQLFAQTHQTNSWNNTLGCYFSYLFGGFEQTAGVQLPLPTSRQTLSEMQLYSPVYVGFPIFTRGSLNQTSE